MSEKIEIRNPLTFENPLCAEVGSEYFFLVDDDDPEFVEGISNRSYAIAASVCPKCEHIKECAAWAIRNEKHGYWGGMTPHDRIRARRSLNITLSDSK